MKLKKNLKVSTGDFWYDLTDGGYLDPAKIIANKNDLKSVLEAIDIIRDFQQSCEDQIEDFYEQEQQMRKEDPMESTGFLKGGELGSDLPCKAEDPKDLEDRIMNCNIPKSAAEWWAKHEIERLRMELDSLTAQLYAANEGS